MRFYLLQMKVNGIKNIAQEVILNFYNKTLKKTFDFNNSNIKSIYGPNGSGKSGLINALDIYKSIMLKENYLSDSRYTTVLNELINKRTNKFTIELTYLCYDRNTLEKDEVVTHQIEIEKASYGQYNICYERIFFHKGNSYDGTKGKVFVEIKNGQMIYTDFPESYKKIEKYTTNLLDKKSISSIVVRKVVGEEEINDYIIGLSYNMLFADRLTIVIGDSDYHKTFIPADKDGEINFLFNHILANTNINVETDVIDSEDLDKYKQHILKLERFIKIFKSDLNNIDIDYKENKDVYIIRKYFNYGDYRVESEFESTGIKKLITLYNAFYDLNNGKIVFIDELDANLHDVYLCKLLEYFSTYAKGQLCFTTHNLAPMEILKKRNYSIDFLSDDASINSWIKNGNYSVSKLYKEGMIKDSPFNIEAFDFIGLFDED